MRVHTFNVGPMDNNTYVVEDEATGAAVVVDPAFGSEAVLDSIRRSAWSVAWVINTHAHLDHVALNAEFVDATSAPLAIHAEELPMLRALDEQASWFGVRPPRYVEPGRYLVDEDDVAFGGAVLHVAHTPGHSAGGICLLGPDFAIVGDVLFAGSIGRTDLPGGDMATLLRSIRNRLFTLEPATIVYPGHGGVTTVGEEMRSNPYAGLPAQTG